VPDDLRSPIKHHLLLHRIEPEQGIWRFYSLMIEQDLFGTICLVPDWVRFGTNGQESVEVFADDDKVEDEISGALELLAKAKQRQGH
jgi:predicted DNA-binding WGR domain protein